jgi:polyphosphate glucokinase
MNVLVVDVGGSHVKFVASNGTDPRRFDSSDTLRPTHLVDRVLDATHDWKYDVISLGYPGRTIQGQPASEPGNLGEGWVGFDFERAFGRPVRIANDAVMQALGGYEGGRMLFLGLGTGLGTALVTEHVVIPMELGNLPHLNGGSLGDALGNAGLERLGREAWRDLVFDTVEVLRDALVADHTLLGGGNAKRVDPLPPATRRGGNDDAFRGGFRLWEEFVEPHDAASDHVWRIL